MLQASTTVRRGANGEALPERTPAQIEADRARDKRVRRLPRYGVAIFDNPLEMTAGWACQSDGEPFYFTNLAHLANETIWITSADFNEFQARGRGMHNLRRGDYLKSPLVRIANDMGLRTEGQYARAASHTLARVIQQSMSIAHTVYGWNDPANDFREDVLHEDIRRSIAQPPRTPQHILPALCSAYQSSSSPQWPQSFQTNSTIVNLRFNRLTYFRMLLERTVPDESWSDEPGSEGYRLGPVPLDRLLDTSRPALIEASVEMKGSSNDLAALAAYGCQMGRRTGLRRWMSQPELMWLIEHTHVRVESALMCVAAKPLPEAAKLPAALTADPLFSLSISAGLVAESHFQAVASEVYNRHLRKKIPSTWAVWMRAYDRAESFRLALAAFQAGFQPITYGGGSITVRLDIGRLPELLKFAEANNIAHPSMHPLFVKHGFIGPDDPLPSTP